MSVYLVNEHDFGKPMWTAVFTHVDLMNYISILDDSDSIRIKPSTVIDRDGYVVVLKKGYLSMAEELKAANQPYGYGYFSATCPIAHCRTHNMVKLTGISLSVTSQWTNCTNCGHSVHLERLPMPIVPTILTCDVVEGVRIISV